MGFQEELDALAQQYQGQPRDPQIDQIYNYVNQSQAPQGSNLPEWLAPLMQSMSGAVGPAAGILSQFTQQPDEYQNQPLSEVYPKSGLMGVGGEMMNRLQANTDPISQLTDYIMGQGKEVMFGQDEQAQGSQQSFPQLPQQEQSLREADPIAQIQQALYSLNGGDLGGEGRGFSKGAAGSSDIAAERYRNVIRDAATQEAGQGAPLTDKERKDRKLEDVMIGTPRDPGLIGGIASQDQEVMTQLVNSVRELYGLSPQEAEDLIKKDGGAGWQEVIGGLGALGLAIVGGKLVRRGKGAALPKMKTSAGSFPKGPRTGVKKAPSADDLVAKMREAGSATAANSAESAADMRDMFEGVYKQKRGLSPEELADLKDMFQGTTTK